MAWFVRLSLLFGDLIRLNERTRQKSPRFQQFNQQRHAEANGRPDKQEGAPYLSVQHQRLP